MLLLLASQGGVGRAEGARPSPLADLARRAVRGFVRLWPLWGILGLALALRLHHNLVFHRPEDFIWSDMKGYWDRAQTLAKAPDAKSPWYVFFPFGTHYFVFAVQKVFGQEKGVVGAAFATLGTLVVLGVYGIARELWDVLAPPQPGARSSRLPAYGAALLAAVWYPQIGLGGYVLSEIPFAFCLTTLTWLSLRLARSGGMGWAVAFGVALAIGVVTRSQLVLSIAMLPVFWLFCKLTGRDFGKVRLAHWVVAALPVVAMLGYASWRVHHHADRFGLVSTNGPLNYVFGRCHAQSVETKLRGEKAGFGPPPFYFLAEREKKDPNGFARLSPVLGKDVKIEGRMWDKEKFEEVAEKCVETSGWKVQAHFAAMHVAMLWAYNGTWPDSAVKETRARMNVWTSAVPFFLVPATLASLWLAFRKRTARFGWIAIHMVALAITAALYFGDTRLRTPYDGIVVAAGVPVLAALGARLLRRLRARRAKPPAVSAG